MSGALLQVEGLKKSFGDTQVLRTDECGCITLRLRDGTYKAQCFLPD